MQVLLHTATSLPDITCKGLIWTSRDLQNFYFDIKLKSLVAPVARWGSEGPGGEPAFCGCLGLLGAAWVGLWVLVGACGWIGCAWRCAIVEFGCVCGSLEALLWFGVASVWFVCACGGL